jgi:phosphatidylethanolamine/phosphatidyl-N-methylethanolamine N-methyltransferase
MQEGLLFFRQLLTNPKDISAIAPSSRWLGRAMVRDIGPQTGCVVEFGPGTGTLTEAILGSGVKPRDLILFEMNADFATHLRLRYPAVTLHHEGAQMAPDLVAGKVGAVISGLPLLSMPALLRDMIVKAAIDILAPDGIFVQFTYGQRPPVSDDLIARLGLVVDKGRKVWLNLPPATVYTFRKKAAANSVYDGMPIDSARPRP